jgi:uncharacterized protein (UPF0548 family)
MRPIRLIEQPTDAELTYREVGATAGSLPAGYHHVTRSLMVGRGHELFVRASDAALHWQIQRRTGLQVSASSPTAEVGAFVRLGVQIGPVRIHAPCRVVYVVDEPRRRGFAYGTLAGHPESGEEAFVVEYGDDESVISKIAAGL